MALAPGLLEFSISDRSLLTEEMRPGNEDCTRDRATLV